MTITRRDAAKGVFYAAIAGAGTVAFGDEYRNVRELRNLVAKVQNDLQRAADFTRNNEKERERYHNVQNHLSEFDRDLQKGHYEKGKLDSAIDDLKNVVKNNTLESHDRDELARDLSDLRALRDGR